MMKSRWILFAPLALVGIALFAFLGGAVVMGLWNWLMPALVGARTITWLQALGLLVLCRILVGGFGSHGGHRGRGPWRGRFADRMADRVAERWERMSPEERDRFRERVRSRCGFDPAGGEQRA